MKRCSQFDCMPRTSTQRLRSDRANQTPIAHICFPRRDGVSSIAVQTSLGAIREPTTQAIRSGGEGQRPTKLARLLRDERQAVVDSGQTSAISLAVVGARRWRGKCVMKYRVLRLEQ